VRKNIVSGTTLIQLVGAETTSAVNFRGHVLVSEITPIGTSLSATLNQRIVFTDGQGNNPTPVANRDCLINGTPVDGVYISTSDSLYVVVSNSSAGGSGKLALIKNLKTNPSCQMLTDILNPSILNVDHNPNVSKMIVDSFRGMIYGAVNASGNSTIGVGLGNSQIFALDTYTQQVTVQNTTLMGTEILYSPDANALHLLDGRRIPANSTGAAYLYKIW
jgi:hypothetical protein